METSCSRHRKYHRHKYQTDNFLQQKLNNIFTLHKVQWKCKSGRNKSTIFTMRIDKDGHGLQFVPLSDLKWKKDLWWWSLFQIEYYCLFSFWQWPLPPLWFWPPVLISSWTEMFAIMSSVCITRVLTTPALIVWLLSLQTFIVGLNNQHIYKISRYQAITLSISHTELWLE